ncbi:hypothetical protein K9M79_03305 [Candidatus Woesearchaeota archaeon]|nr:hypothetical protein [Candidatus Woesearchaeota archaeon]
MSDPSGLLGDFFEQRRSLEAVIEGFTRTVRTGFRSIAMCRNDVEYNDVWLGKREKGETQPGLRDKLRRYSQMFDDVYTTQQITDDFMQVLSTGANTLGSFRERYDKKETWMENPLKEPNEDGFCLDAVYMRNKAFISAVAKAGTLEYEAVQDTLGGTAIIRSGTVPYVDFTEIHEKKDEVELSESIDALIRKGIFSNADHDEVFNFKTFQGKWNKFIDLYEKKAEEHNIQALEIARDKYVDFFGNHMINQWPDFYIHKNKPIDFSYQKVIWQDESSGDSRTYNIMIGHANDSATAQTLFSGVAKKWSNMNSYFACNAKICDIVDMAGFIIDDEGAPYFSLLIDNMIYSIRGKPDEFKSNNNEVSADFKENMEHLAVHIGKAVREKQVRVTDPDYEFDLPNIHRVSSKDYRLEAMDLPLGFIVVPERNVEEKRKESKYYFNLASGMGLMPDHSDLAWQSRIKPGKEYLREDKKPNGYESIHFKLEGGVELKLRTGLMDWKANYDKKAGHEAYKDQESNHKSLYKVLTNYTKYLEKFFTEMPTATGRKSTGKNALKARDLQVARAKKYLKKAANGTVYLVKDATIGKLHEMGQNMDSPFMFLKDAYKTGKWIMYDLGIKPTQKDIRKLNTTMRNAPKTYLDNQGVYAKDHLNVALAAGEFLHQIGLVDGTKEEVNKDISVYADRVYYNSVLSNLESSDLSDPVTAAVAHGLADYVKDAMSQDIKRTKESQLYSQRERNKWFSRAQAIYNQSKANVKPEYFGDREKLETVPLRTSEILGTYPAAYWSIIAANDIMEGSGNPVDAWNALQTAVNDPLIKMDTGLSRLIQESMAMLLSPHETEYIENAAQTLKGELTDYQSSFYKPALAVQSTINRITGSNYSIRDFLTPVGPS